MNASPWFQTSLGALTDRSARITIVGCGYVGLTLALESARAGFRVTGVESDEGRAKELRAGVNPVPDVDVPAGELDRLRGEGRLVFSAELTDAADVFVVCVPTPLRDGSPDLRFVEQAGESVARVLQRGALVVLESTTYPGTTEELLRPILEEGSKLVAGDDFALAHSPERINPGDAQWGLANTPKVVGGFTSESAELARTFYGHVCSQVVTVSSPRAAEMAKLLENTYRHVNIALANEMSIVCQDLGIDPWEVIEAASSKPFGFTAFHPGPGVGGHCILPDERVIVRRGLETDIVRIEDLWAEEAARGRPVSLGEVDVLTPERLDVASLDGGGGWDSITGLGRRPYDGACVRLTTRDGRSIRVTADHLMLVEQDGGIGARAAAELRVGDLVPVWRGHEVWDAMLNPRIDLLEACSWSEHPHVGVALKQGDWGPWMEDIRRAIGYSRAYEVVRSGRLPLHVFEELERAVALDVSHEDIELRTGRGPGARSFPAVTEITPDVARLIGYYLAEGCVTGTPPRAVFTFHRDEVEAKSDLLKILDSLGLIGTVSESRRFQSTQIKVSNRPFTKLLVEALGSGRNSYDARIPPVLLGASAAHREQLLSGLLSGDGSEVGYWSASEQLAHGVEYLFLSLGYVPALYRRARQPGMGMQVHGTQRQGEPHLVPVRSIEWFDYRGPVYSIETSSTKTFAATNGILVHNCIPIDPQYLAWRVRGKLGHAFRLLETAHDVNQRMPAHVARRASEILNEEGKAVRRASVLVLGVAYKGGSGDTRESPALRVTERLVSAGADVAYHDPHVPSVVIGELRHESVELTPERLAASDLVLVLSDHPEVDYELVLAHAPCVYDTRGVTRGRPIHHRVHRS